MLLNAKFKYPKRLGQNVSEIIVQISGKNLYLKSIIKYVSQKNNNKFNNIIY